MASTNSQVLPAPPSLTRSLLAGFDAISNHVGLILFSIFLDLFLWLGPKLPLRTVMDTIVSQLPESANRQMIVNASERLNLLDSLRSFPIGVPSLIAGEGPLSTPLAVTWKWSVPSWGAVVGLWLVFTLAGLMIGTLYFSMLSEAVVLKKIELLKVVQQWPWNFWQVFRLTIAMVAVLFGLGIPFACLLSILGLAGISLSMVIMIPFVVLVIWFLFPLVFSPHGIFVNRRTTWEAIKDSTRIVRWTFPNCGLFVVAAVVISEGLAVLWRIPAERSWLRLVGIAGHSFISASLLAASFVYYHEADQWVQKMLAQLKGSSG
jgi:hypothetical protein